MFSPGRHGYRNFCTFFFNLSFNQQSEYKVFYKLMCWLAGSLDCRLPNVVSSPRARRSRKLSHYWLMFGFSWMRFLDHTQRRTTVGRTPLDKWSACRRDLYLTTYNTHNRQTSMTTVEFEPTISAGERPQTYVLGRVATENGPLKSGVFRN